MNGNNLRSVVLGLTVGMTTACRPQFEPCGEAETDYVRAVAGMFDVTAGANPGLLGDDERNVLREIVEGNVDIVCAPDGATVKLGSDKVELGFDAVTNGRRKGGYIGFSEPVLTQAMGLYPLSLDQVDTFHDVQNYINGASKNAILECLEFNDGEDLALCNGPVDELPLKILIHEVLHTRGLFEGDRDHSDAFYEAADKANQCDKSCNDEKAKLEKLRKVDPIYIGAESAVENFKLAVGYDFSAWMTWANGVYDECFVARSYDLRVDWADCLNAGKDEESCNQERRLGWDEAADICEEEVAACLPE